MSNTIHIYGDSFSAGHGLNPFVSIIPKQYKPYYKYTWGVQIAEFLQGYSINNKGVSGASNELIKDSLLSEINSFQEGDIVVVGVTQFARLSILLDLDYHRGPQYLCITGLSIIEYLKNLNSDNPQSDFIPKVHQKKCERYNISPSIIHDTFKYMDNWYFDKKYEEQNQRQLKKIYYNLIEFFNRVGVKMYVWDYTVWGYGESLSSWSKGDYEDKHWSPNGQNFFLNYLLWGIENDYRYLDLKLLRSHKDSILEFSKQNSLDTYISHDEEIRTTI